MGLGYHQIAWFSSDDPSSRPYYPLFLENKDVVDKGVTGSGKTLSFIIPIIERLIQLEPGPHSMLLQLSSVPQGNWQPKHFKLSINF
ncbi:hypothetical protein KEM48_000256 [Puccinia striiformis f. sp. tritici PST-130]|nr:hypothetical protein KEM48_000256 [Puccinia striiformis f. sp. tritici PST-130]